VRPDRSTNDLRRETIPTGEELGPDGLATYAVIGVPLLISSLGVSPWGQGMPRRLDERGKLACCPRYRTIVSTITHRAQQRQVLDWRCATNGGRSAIEPADSRSNSAAARGLDFLLQRRALAKFPTRNRQEIDFNCRLTARSRGLPCDLAPRLSNPDIARRRRLRLLQARLTALLNCP
jgi:hypothetical protein